MLLQSWDCRPLLDRFETRERFDVSVWTLSSSLGAMHAHLREYKALGKTLISEIEKIVAIKMLQKE